MDFVFEVYLYVVGCGAWRGNATCASIDIAEVLLAWWRDGKVREAVILNISVNLIAEVPGTVEPRLETFVACGDCGTIQMWPGGIRRRKPHQPDCKDTQFECGMIIYS
jgi:hypothetical protein